MSDHVLGLDADRPNWTVDFSMADMLAIERTDVTPPDLVFVGHLTDGWAVMLFRVVRPDVTTPLPVEIHTGLGPAAARDRFEQLQATAETIRTVDHRHEG